MKDVPQPRNLLMEDLKQTDVGENEVWGVDSADMIFKQPANVSGSGKQIPRKLNDILASGNG